MSVRRTIPIDFFCPVGLPSFSSSRQLAKYRQLPPWALKSLLSQRLSTPQAARLDQKVPIAPAVLICRWRRLKCKARSTVLTFLLRSDFPGYVVQFQTFRTQYLRSTNSGSTASIGYFPSNRCNCITKNNTSMSAVRIDAARKTISRIRRIPTEETANLSSAGVEISGAGPNAPDRYQQHPQMRMRRVSTAQRNQSGQSHLN